MDGRADRLGGEYLRVKFSPPPPHFPPKGRVEFHRSSGSPFALMFFSALFLLWRARLADSELFPHTKQNLHVIHVYFDLRADHPGLSCQYRCRNARLVSVRDGVSEISESGSGSSRSDSEMCLVSALDQW